MILQIKTYCFEVANTAFQNTHPRDQDIVEKMGPLLKTPEEIDFTINTFMRGYQIVDVKVNHVDVKYHNNGGKNTVFLYYTILYKEGFDGHTY